MTRPNIVQDALTVPPAANSTALVRLAAANLIIAAQTEALASAHAALQVARVLPAMTSELQRTAAVAAIAAAINKIEGKSTTAINKIEGKSK